MTFFKKFWAWAGMVSIPLSATADLSLGEAVDRAREHDPRFQRLDADLGALREQADQLLGTRRPSVGGFGALDYEYLDADSAFFGNRREDYAGYRLGVEARQALYRRDWSARERRAGAISETAQRERSARLQSLLFDVAERYLAVLIATENLRLGRTEAATATEALEDAQIRFAAETIPSADLREAEARQALTQARLIALRQELADARERLEESTGPVDNLRFLDPGADPAQGMDTSREVWAQRAVEQSPRLAAVAGEARIAREEIEARRAERFPVLDLVGRVARIDTSDSEIGQRANEGRISLELNVPFYQGGSLASSEREARFRSRSADLERIRVERELRRQVRTALRGIETAQRQMEAFASVVRAAQAAEEATRDGFEAGTRTMLELLNAQSETVAARRDLTNARHQLLLATLRLHFVSGQLDRSRIDAVDAILLAPNGQESPDTTKQP